jgi:formiminotetrahydrofolate cyclodeaminase
MLKNRLSESPDRNRGLEEFISAVAGTSPLLPGGGSVAALAGALAAALGEMVSGLTEGRKKYVSVDSQVREIHTKLKTFRDTLWRLVEEDSAAFDSLMEAMKLPKESEEQKVRRTEEIEKATRIATEAPLRTAQASSKVLEYMMILAKIGNQNARCDASVGAQMAFASLKGAQYNILGNIPGLRDRPFAERCRAEVMDLAQKGKAILQQVDQWITGSVQS